MLEKYDIEVDMAESAEQAIEYLKGNRPDAIFMDHLMPGMDGLQAVKAIKGNPQTAMIPIMMYTSQEGELYVGQARALGAMGVLPKQVRPVDVSKVLYELHLLPDRRDMTEPALQPVELESGTAVEKPPQPRGAGGGNIDWGRRVEQAVKDQAVDIRRFIVASLDSFATRIISDLRTAGPVQGVDPIAPPPVPPNRNVWPWVAAIGGIVLAIASAASWLVERNQLASTRAEIAGLKAANGELLRSRIDLSAAVKDLTGALATANSSVPSGAGTGTAAVAAHSEAVPYGEIAFDRSRLEVLREMLMKLEGQGFHGVVIVAVRVKSHPKPDRQPGRRWVALNSVLEDFNRRSERPVDQEFAAPIKQVAFAGIGVSGKFILVDRWHEVPGFFFHFAEQVVQFGGVLKF